MTPEFFRQKAREICYALVKVSYFVRRTDLRQRLERLAFEFLENSAILSADNTDALIFNQIFKNIAVLDALIRMGHSLYEIEPVNATLLIRELNDFNSTIRQFRDSAIAELPNLDTALSSLTKNNDLSIRKELNREEDNDSELGVNSAIRQNMIIEKIRQFTNNSANNSATNENPQDLPLNSFRLRDLLVEFPDISNRTLRYDLERLCSQGVIEKIGSRGPACYYRLINV